MKSLAEIYIALVFLTSTSSASAGKSNDNQDKLISTVAIFRHGDRNPDTTYKNDPNKDESNFPDGFSQLVNRGKLRAYKLGQWYRNRYNNFLPKYYSPTDIYVQSTDVDRTLMSAAAVLAGLYRPKGHQAWLSTLLWQPIPIHTLPTDQDAVLSMSKTCSKYNSLIAALILSDEYQQVNKQNAELYQYLTEYSGDNITNVTEFAMFVNRIETERLLGLIIPKWIVPVYSDMIYHLNYVNTLSTFTTDLARLLVGPFFSELTETFLEKATNRSDTYQRFRMYSAHDNIIINILNAMNLYDFEVPQYSSTLIFELYSSSKNNSSYVNIFYRKNQTIIRELQLEGCIVDCNLDDFIRILKPVTVDLTQWGLECNYIDNEN